MPDVIAGKVIIEMEAKVDRLQGEIQRMQEDLKHRLGEVQRHAEGAERGIRESFLGIGDAWKRLIAILTVEQIGEKFAQAIERVAETGEIANRIGITTKTLQVLERQAVLSGGSLDQLHSALERIAEQQLDPNSFLARLFSTNGVQISQNTEENLKSLMDLINNAGDAQQKLFILTNIVGRRVAGSLVQTFDSAANDIDAKFKHLEQSGLAHSEAQIEEAKKIRDKYREYMDDIAVYWQSIVIHMIESTHLFDNAVSEQEANLKRRLELTQRLEYVERRARELEAGKPSSGDAISDALTGIGVGGTDQGKLANAIEQINKLTVEIQQLGKARRELGPDINPDRTKDDFLGKPVTTVLPPTQKETEDQKALKKAIEDVIISTQREITSLVTDAQAQGKSAGEVAKERKERELLNQLEDAHRAHGGVVTADEIAKVNQLADTYGKVAQAIADHQRDLDSLKEAGDKVFGDLENTINQFIDTGKLSFKDFISSVIRDMAKLGVHNLLSFIESGTPGTGNTGLLGLIGSLFPAPSVPSGTASVGGVAGVSAVGGIVQKILPTSGGSASYPFASLIQEAAAKYGLDPNTLAGLIHQESRFNPDALGSMTKYGRAEGLGQLLPGTAKDLGVTDAFDPRQNIFGSAQYLRQMTDRFGGDQNKGLAAYYTGAGNVDKFGISNSYGSPTPELYVKQINEQAAKYATAVTNTAQTAEQASTSFTGQFTPALNQLIGAITGGGGSGGVGSFFGIFGALGAGGTQRAEGGPMLPGRSYTVGERGPETVVMGRRAAMVIPSASNQSSNSYRVRIEAHATDDLHLRIVEHASQIAQEGDRRVLQTAERNAPRRMSKFNSLGT